MSELGLTFTRITVTQSPTRVPPNKHQLQIEHNFDVPEMPPGQVFEALNATLERAAAAAERADAATRQAAELADAAAERAYQITALGNRAAKMATAERARAAEREALTIVAVAAIIALLLFFLLRI